jgi:hypothetical protein
VALFLACQLLSIAPAAAAPRAASHPALRLVDGHEVGLGKLLHSADGGQIFGYDIDQHGADGVLATSQIADPGYQVSVQTFDQVTAKVTHTFAEHTGERHSYGVDGIFAGDVGLVTHYVVPKGTIYAKRFYQLMDPVTAQRFTGDWTPPIKNFDVIQAGRNQSTTTSVLYGIDLNHHSDPYLLVTDLVADTSSAIPLDVETYKVGSAQMAQWRNRAVLAASNGTVGPGLLPTIAVVNLSTGHISEWDGIAEGPFGAGFINGLDVDPRTGIACTTTELNAQVEFYDLAKRTGFAVQLPGTGPADQLNSGATVVSDPKHKLFLVAVPQYAPTGGSAIVVYRENGDLVEAITGFDFTVTPGLVINPKTRMGYADGPTFDTLQQFFY